MYTVNRLLPPTFVYSSITAWWIVSSTSLRKMVKNGTNYFQFVLCCVYTILPCFSIIKSYESKDWFVPVPWHCCCKKRVVQRVLLVHISSKCSFSPMILPHCYDSPYKCKVSSAEYPSTFVCFLELLKTAFAFLDDSVQISSTIFLLINSRNAFEIDEIFFASFIHLDQWKQCYNVQCLFPWHQMLWTTNAFQT